MDSRRYQQLPNRLFDMCEDYAANMVRHYRSGGSPQSLAVSSRNAENNVKLQLEGKMAEVVFCLDIGIDPEVYVKWNWGVPDNGIDIEYREEKVDVKSIVFDHHFLIWPTKKAGFLHQKKFTSFALVKVDAASRHGLFQGWCTKGEFQLRHKVAERGHFLDEGTLYLHEQYLHRPDGFPGRNKLVMTMDTYDWRKDSYLSWTQALQEIRKQKIVMSNLLPLTNEERTLSVRSGR